MSLFDTVPSTGERSAKGIAYVNDLRCEVSSGRSSTFSRSLLAHIKAHPEQTLKQAWDEVEGDAASNMRINPRPWPNVFEN